MIKLTQSTLDKLQELVTLAGYSVRHEKGNFKSGSCLTVTGKLIVLNKFSPVEAKVTYLIDALQHLPIEESLLDSKRLSFLKEVQKTHFLPDGEIDQSLNPVSESTSDSPPSRIGEDE